jgi:hypothetical protein
MNYPALGKEREKAGHRPLQTRVERSGLTALVLQTPFRQFACFFLQHRDLLVARMQITPYNLHVLGSSPPSLGC